MSTVLVVLLYFCASVFIVLGFMMLFAYRRTGVQALLLYSFVYSGSGLVAGYTVQWWPLLTGFVVAWLLKLSGHDIDKPPRSSRDDAQTDRDSPGSAP